jgi:hypothetical protein
MVRQCKNKAAVKSISGYIFGPLWVARSFWLNSTKNILDPLNRFFILFIQYDSFATRGNFIYSNKKTYVSWPSMREISL